MAELIGATLVDRPPVDITHLPIRRGLNVVYGKNGVGKSRLLDAFLRLLRTDGLSERLAYDDPTTPTRALYLAGGLHVHLDAHRLDHRHGPIWHAMLDLVAGDSIGFWEAAKQGEQVDIETEWLAPAVDRVVAGATWPDPTPAEAEEVLAGGYFMLSPSRTGIEVFASSVPSRTLTQRWSDHAPVGLALAGEISYLAWPEPMASRTLPAGVLRSLPPLPSQLGVSEPDWLPIPVAHIGAIEREELEDGTRIGVFNDLFRPVTESKSSASGASLNRALRAGARRDEPHEPRSKTWLLAGGEASPELRRSADLLSEVATATLGQFFDEAPRLEVVVRTPEKWFDGDPAVWAASWAHARVPIAGLGSAHERFARLAINLAQSRTDESSMSLSPTPFAIVDEPERALHRSAEECLSGALPSLGDYVLVATHSPSLLGMGANLIHAELDNNGRLLINHRDLTRGASPDRATAAELGFTPLDIAARWRLIVLVEGPHDRAVIEQFCEPEVARADVHVACLNGTHGLEHVAEMSLVFDMTDAKFLVVTDNTKPGWLHAFLQGLRRQEERRSLSAIDSARRSNRSPEELLVLDLLARAVESGRLDRFVDPFGFRKRDIVRYLPAEQFVPDASSWQEIDRRFKAETGRSQFRRGDGLEFKKWINDRYQGACRLPNIRRVAHGQVAAWSSLPGGLAKHRPSEFSALADRIMMTVDGRVGQGP